MFTCNPIQLSSFSPAYRVFTGMTGKRRRQPCHAYLPLFARYQEFDIFLLSKPDLKLSSSVGGPVWEKIFFQK
jgi:hypothetical protein